MTASLSVERVGESEQDGEGIGDLSNTLRCGHGGVYAEELQRSSPPRVRVRWSQFSTSALAALLIAVTAALPLVAAPSRSVAITFDDLPDLTSDQDSIATQRSLTTRLIAALKHNQVPAIGFVNEGQLDDQNDVVDPAKERLLELWLEGGLTLGNHTFSHMNLHEATPQKFEQDIMDGERITRPLMARHHESPRWFRHPYLNTGRSLEVRQEIDSFLSAHGYAVAPVTLDDSDWIFGMAWSRTNALGRWRMRRAYLRYMERRFEWAERKSRQVFHREIPQVLLLHASQLNAATFEALAAMMRRRGYRFITIEEACSDPAYHSPDNWIEDGGVTWIERWGTTAGISESEFEHDPQVPRWVQKVAGAKDE